MTQIYVLTNHKGGVGKSMSATNIAFGISQMLAQFGAANPRVLLIDTDSQEHATLVTTNRNDFGRDNSLYTVLNADRRDAATVLKECTLEGNVTMNVFTLLGTEQWVVLRRLLGRDIFVENPKSGTQ
ncbi:MAG: ParA family protein [Chloroflexi bacterium]|nr:ParA family protein [Chloroflexota bacterium]